MLLLDLFENGHEWEKVNLAGLVNRKGIYDLYRCKRCGVTGKSYSLGCIEIPERNRKKASVCKGALAIAKSYATAKGYVKVLQCGAFGKAFSNLKPGSIHKVIPPPNGENENRGVWVMGVGEPVKLLYDEFLFIDDIAEGKKIEG